MAYDKLSVKEQITIDDVYLLLDYLDAQPQMFNDYIVAKTICHGGDSHKLYYYDNTQLFKCYTGHCGTFDIFELIQKVHDISDLNEAVFFIVNFFHLQNVIDSSDVSYNLTDWKLFKKYEKLDNINVQEQSELRLPEYDNVIKYFPRPRILDWEKEHISKEVCDYMNICYNPIEGSILIPHYNEFHQLIGIRQRTLVQEQEIYGKYRPAYIQGKLYTHPLAFNLYGLDTAKQNIKDAGVAIVVESEKSVLEYMSYFGTKSNLCVAVCGSSLSKYQFDLLLKYGAKEVVIGFDKDFTEVNSEEYFNVVKKLENIRLRYGGSALISFLFDQAHLLGYKDSPLDCGKERFLYLWRNRILP